MRRFIKTETPGKSSPSISRKRVLERESDEDLKKEFDKFLKLCDKFLPANTAKFVKAQANMYFQDRYV